MAFVAVDKDGKECIYSNKPYRDTIYWNFVGIYIKLPKGSIKKLIGRKLTWDDEAVEID